MKCPKCGYLGFERVDRCRNCGYEFALARSQRVSELPLRDDLFEADSLASSDSVADIGFLKEDAEPSVDFDLPLFGPPIPDDVPLITKPSAPRAPLSVRRPTIETPRVRPEPQLLDLDEPDADIQPSPRTLFASASSAESDVGAAQDTAGLAARLVAGAIDLHTRHRGRPRRCISRSRWSNMARPERASQDPSARLFDCGERRVPRGVHHQRADARENGCRDPSRPRGSRSADVGRAACAHSSGRCSPFRPASVFSPPFQHDRRGLHDRLAGTRVVRASA